MKYYLYDNDGYFKGVVYSQKGQVPPQSTPIEPPPLTNGEYAVFNGKWRVVTNPPPPPQIDEVMAQKLNEINGAFEQAMDTLVAGYPEREISSWPQQEKEARAYLADNTASTPLLDALATARGVDKALIAQKITQKAAQYAQAAGALIGKRQALEDAINAATTLEELEAIQWS